MTNEERSTQFVTELENLMHKWGITLSAPWEVTLDEKKVSGNAKIVVSANANWRPPKADEPQKSAPADNPEVETPANGRKKEKI